MALRLLPGETAPPGCCQGDPAGSVVLLSGHGEAQGVLSRPRLQHPEHESPAGSCFQEGLEGWSASLSECQRAEQLCGLQWTGSFSLTVLVLLPSSGSCFYTIHSCFGQTRPSFRRTRRAPFSLQHIILIFPAFLSWQSLRENDFSLTGQAERTSGA